MKNKIKTKQIMAVLIMAALTTAVTGFAADNTMNNPAEPAVASATAPAADAWQFGVTVPLWAPQIDGNVTIQGNQVNTHVSFDQLKDHLDAVFSLAVEARKGKFGMFGDVGYMKFSLDGTVALGVRDYVDLKFLVANAGVSYQLIKTELEHPLVLEGTLGVRYWYTATDLSLNGPGGGTLFSGSKIMNLVDPVIGLRGSQYLTQKFHLDFSGDIGGFGISDNQAELDWSATGAATYDFAQWFSLSAGYRALGVDASNGSGTSKNGANLTFHGVLVAAKFTF